MTLISHPLRALAIVLIFTVTTTSFGNAVVSAAPIDQAILHKKLRSRGTGKGVKVTQIDGTVVKGNLAVIDKDSFQVIPKDATQAIVVLNTQVSKFSNDGHSTGTKIAIGATVGVVAFLVIGGAVEYLVLRSK